MVDWPYFPCLVISKTKSCGHRLVNKLGIEVQTQTGNIERKILSQPISRALGIDSMSVVLLNLLQH